MPASKSRSSHTDIARVVMDGEMAGVLDGVGIVATLAFKQIKSFIQPA